ncbi:MAG: hypoxanthine phosphoribosyltransferase [Ruminococcaceae bacterium]|nr:hypoxanthine phosphoribosyltransferase [Oscillospiraceae bacterium]
MKHLEENIERVLLTKEEIAAKVCEVAEEMGDFYKGQEVVMVCILKGSVTFFADLAREIPFPAVFDFMCVSSYGSGSVSGGSVRILKDLTVDITDKHVVIVEDILDTGNTLSALFEQLKARKPASLKLCCLLDKPDRRTKPISADFLGFTIPDEFVVGYGLDYNEAYRQLPYVGILKRSVYEK